MAARQGCRGTDLPAGRAHMPSRVAAPPQPSSALLPLLPLIGTGCSCMRRRLSCGRWGCRLTGPKTQPGGFQLGFFSCFLSCDGRLGGTEADCAGTRGPPSSQLGFVTRFLLAGERLDGRG